jgi:hypothetical protein
VALGVRSASLEVRGKSKGSRFRVQGSDEGNKVQGNRKKDKAQKNGLTQTCPPAVRRGTLRPLREKQK